MSKPRDAKYRQIAQQLLQEIRENMVAGDKLPPEAQLAERFGVHFMTVREALKVLQDGGVIQRQRAIGTQVVNPLGGSWVSILCEMNVFSPTSHCLFQRSVIYHLRHFLRDASIPSRVSIGETEPGSKPKTNLTSLDFVADVEANRLAGVIALSANPNPYWIRKLAKQGVPAIGSNSHFPYWVSLDRFESVSRAVRALMDYGCKRIAFIGWSESHGKGKLAPELEELLLCYPEVLRREWIKCDIHPEHPQAGAVEFKEIWDAGDEKPDGLIIDDEHLTPDIERVLAERGIRVPEDILLVSHLTRGNTRPFAYPTILMVSDPRLYAFRMAGMFLKLYRGEKLPSSQTSITRELVDLAVRSHPALEPPVWAQGPATSSIA